MGAQNQNQQQPLDFSKPLQTLDGKKVRIYAKDGKQPYCIHGAFKCGNIWVIALWTVDGRKIQGYRNNPLDLINAPVQFGEGMPI